MRNHWLLRIGNGENFKNSSKYNIWGINSKSSKNFLSLVKEDDILWFVKNKSNGRIFAMAQFKSYNKRVLGPLINMSMTNEELGWNDPTTNWIVDIEIHYNNLYNLDKCNIITNLKGMVTIRQYQKEKIDVNLEEEYNNIIRYSNTKDYFN